MDKIQYVTIGTGSCEFTASILSNLLIERLGRKMLLMGGYILMAGWAVVFMVALSLQHTVPWMPYLSMACIFAYILSFGMGPAGVTGVLPTEIFNQMARPAAYMIAGSLMWINLFFVGMVFPFLVSGFGQFCFIPFCAVCLLSSLFIGLVLPETKGKTLPAIASEYNKLNFRGQEAQCSVTAQTQYQLGKVLHSTAM
ncbi:hypothetical protein MATL_G00063060 [Megalops atlanticus]|uniref:Major facilitator superfamily (MFS) profile domain-containing protein n=1 Tax=Megalops atlanticus TaxID=7932 RepID=A0A9D3THL3_MEGAT|nr:hypothetical protein MATL_G00063060 [Megalops atlanticus]